MRQKEKYMSPRVEVIEMENEGIIAASVNDFPNVDMHSTTPTRGYSNSASGSDLEDMINDILTVGE